MIRRKRTTRGFTLVEVLLVVAIIGVIATVVVVNVGGVFDKSNISNTENLISVLEQKMQLYKVAVNHYPSEEEGGLNALLVKPTFDDESLANKWAGPYVKKKQLKDPWGNEFNYELQDQEDGDTTRQVIHIWSNGPNGTDDSGEGDDVKNWDDDEEGA